MAKPMTRNMRVKYHTLALKNGISEQVHLIPETSRIEDYYRASTVVAIASVSEGFSLVCLEAMACGLTTIATDSVGIHSEVIKHGETGFLFPVSDMNPSAAFSLILYQEK